MSDEKTEQTHGIAVEHLLERAQQIEYPISMETAIDTFGNETIEHGGEEVTVESVLTRYQQGTRHDTTDGEITIETAEDLTELLVTAIGEDGDGSENNSDHGVDTANAEDTESF